MINEVFKSKQHGNFIVIDYIDARNVKIRFIETGTVKTTTKQNVESGSVRDNNFPSIHGIAYIGEGPHKSMVNYKSNPIYTRWKSMIDRCFCEKAENYDRYGGSGVFVHSSWLNFQNFADWFIAACLDKNEDPCETNLQLDKDFIKGPFDCPETIQGKTYGPYSCALLSQKENHNIAHTGKGLTASFKHKDGRQAINVNVMEFIKEYSLNRGGTYRVLNGKAKSIKGWAKL